MIIGCDSYTYTAASLLMATASIVRGRPHSRCQYDRERLVERDCDCRGRGVISGGEGVREEGGYASDFIWTRKVMLFVQELLLTL